MTRKEAAVFSWRVAMAHHPTGLHAKATPAISPVVVPPQDCADGPPRMLRRHLRVRPAGLHHRPLLVRQRHPTPHKAGTTPTTRNGFRR